MHLLCCSAIKLFGLEGMQCFCHYLPAWSNPLCPLFAAAAYSKCSAERQYSKRVSVAQGPMEHTAFDFWTMAYGAKSGVVLMLTRHREGPGMVKVHAHSCNPKGLKTLSAWTAAVP